MKNSDKPIPFNEVEKYGYERAAKLFSEGSEELEQLLLTLWEMGIQTNACCKGTEEFDHKQGLIKMPYITLNLTEDRLNLILNLVEDVLKDKSLKRTSVEFSLVMLRDRNDLIAGRKRGCFLNFNQNCLSNFQTKQFFKKLLNVVNHLKEHQKENKDQITNPSLILINDLATKTFDDNDYSIITIKTSANKKNYFSCGKYGLKPKFKTHITCDNIDKIKEFYADFTCECISNHHSNEI